MIKTFFSKINTLVVGTKKNIRADGWDNLGTNLGNIGRSRSGATRYIYSQRLEKDTLTNIYLSDSLGRRVVNILIDDAFRSFIDADPLLLKELSRLKAKQKLIEVATWARLYGGALLIAFVDDGLDLDKKLNIEKIKKVVSFRVFDRHQVSWTQDDLSIDYYDEHYGEPEYYTIQQQNTLPFRVHRSRCHLFQGERIPVHEKVKNQGWDGSILQSVYEAIKNYGTSMNACSEIVQDFIQIILGIDGLADMLRQGNDDLVMKRSTIIDMTRSVANTIFLDSENENYSKHSSSVSGLPELLDRFVEAVSGATGIPITKLTGRAPSGLNATGEHDAANWNGIVDSYRRDQIEPAITWITEMLEAQKLWKGARPSTFEWQFPALKVTGEEERAKIRLLAAQADAIYMQNGAIDPITLIKARFPAGEWTTDPIFEEKDIDAWAQEKEKIEEMEANADLKDTRSDGEKVKEKLYEKILESF